MIVLLGGANDFAVHQALEKMTADFLNKHGMHAIEHLDGERLELSRVPEVVQGASLFAPQRLVILRDASKNKPLWDMLGDWLEKASPDVSLVIMESVPDKRTRTYKQVQKHGEVRDFPELQEHDLTKWLLAVAKQEGASLDTKTAGYLVRQVGTDQWRLFMELQKLIGSNATVTIEAIDELVEPNPQASAFELLDAVLAGDSVKTTLLLNRLKASEDPYKLFGLLVSQVQTLALVITAQGKSSDLIAKEAGIHPFVVRKMQNLSRTMSYTQLQIVVSSVAMTDSQLKSTGMDPWILLEQCLGKIASR